ncbi:OppA family ABC transporter substrate-binding lipoprotein [Metamycoplasma equirhinis]|uniref:OppA family ABC transporter substrate-binding lipoprotein n=1 Tax=Metamycoplasma equirhinis TaxID=92402 RepID=UPI003594096D
MKKKFLAFLPLLCLIFSFPISASCQKNNFNKNHHIFIDYSNLPNDFGNFGYLLNNSQSENIRKINLITGSKLFRLKSQKQPIIDFRDNIVLQPTELFYQFEYAKNITINSKIANHVQVNSFDNYLIDEISYKNDEPKNINKFYPKKDKGNGFNLPYLFIPSKNTKSINSQLFFESLSNSNGFKIEVNDINSKKWIDYKGNIINSNVTINDFRLGILKSLLLDERFRNNWLKKKNIALTNKQQSFIKDNPTIFKNSKFVDYLETYSIDIETLLDFNSNFLEFKTQENKYINLLDFFKSFFIYTNYADALPFEYINEKYKNFKNNIDWFFEYGQTYKNTLYSSYYYISKNSNIELKLIKNETYDANNSSLKEIILKYNPMAVPNETFGSQMYNAIKQNIVSTLNFDDLNINQRQEILKNYHNYNINYDRRIEKYFPHTKIINNLLPLNSKHYFNDEFSQLYYGVNINELNENLELIKLQNPKAFAFRSLFNNLINHYGLLNGNKDVWLSQAPADLEINAKNNGLNYSFIRDALVNISKPIVFSYENNSLENWHNIYQFQNKKWANEIDNSGIDNKLKPFNLNQISIALNSLINDFYANNKKVNDIEFDIPIQANLINYELNNKLAKMTKLFNDINIRLKPNFVIIDNYEKYREYFLSNKSIYKENNFNLLRANTEEFISHQIISANTNLLLYMNIIYKTISDSTNTYLETKNLIKHLKSKSIEFSDNSFSQFKIFLENKENKIKNALLEYLRILPLKNTINLINEINNIISYTISFENEISSENFNKKIYQKFIKKPIAFDGLDYLQDIEII